MITTHAVLARKSKNEILKIFIKKTTKLSKIIKLKVEL